MTCTSGLLRMRILLADDHNMVRDALKSYIERLGAGRPDRFSGKFRCRI